MEVMDYRFFPPNTQPYQYNLSYGAEGLLGVGTAGSVSDPNLDDPLDANAFLNASFDYNSYGSSLGRADDSLASLAPSAGSPPAQQLAIFPNASVDSGISLDSEVEQQGRRSSSEEKDILTPAQSRRKAQNRAAQRAFRERKERHVRDLEAKLNLLTSTTSSLQSDNERLKLMLQRAQTENEILRATQSSSPSSSQLPSFVDDPTLLPQPRAPRPGQGAGEPNLDRARLANGLLSTGSSPGSSTGHGTQLLSASATWDLLQSHPLYLSGAVDIGEVCERLKKMAKCEGMGPMFELDDVRKVIEEVGRSGGDGLI